MPRKTQIDVADWFEITWLCVTESVQKSLAPIIRPILTWLKKRCLPIEGKIWERWTTSWWTPICTITSTTSTLFTTEENRTVLTASTALRFCQSGNFIGDYCSVSQTPTVTWHTITSVRCILADSAGLPNRSSRHMGPAFFRPPLQRWCDLSRKLRPSFVKLVQKDRKYASSQRNENYIEASIQQV